LPGGHVTHTQLEQCQDLTKIVSDGTSKSHNRNTRRAGWETGAEAPSHQLQHLRHLHDQLFSTAAS